MASDGNATDGNERREDLAYGGICPVCGEPFNDGYDGLEEGESYDARICIVEKDGNGEGAMLVHLEESADGEQTPQEEWAEHNEPFDWDPPEKPGDAWSSDEYQQLYDRFISRRTEWFCDKCTGRGPIRSLQKARSHVSGQHGQELVKQYETPRDELETATDGGTEQSDTESREAENRGLGEFAGGDE